MAMENENEIVKPDQGIINPELWVPDLKLITDSEQVRQEMEWLRKKNGYSGSKPTELGIDAYRYSSKLHPKFFEGRNPPAVPLDSLENIEWYEDQLKRCIYGFEYRGQRITGDHYWFLNMFPFLVAKLNKAGKVTNEFDVNFAYYAGMHDYVFKTIEQAHYEGKGFLWMSGRGSGKSYVVLSIIAKTYHIKPKSHGIVSASHSGHANETFSKLLQALDSISEVHPTLSLHRLTDTKSLVESGQEILRDGIKYKEGPRSKIQKVIYGDNSGATRGSRPDIQLMEECMAPGTKVLMYDMSYKNIEDIIKGDLVMGIDSLPKIVGKTTIGKDEMFKIYQSKGISYIVNSSHKLYVEQRYGVTSDGIKIITPKEYADIGSAKKKSATYGIKIGCISAHSNKPFMNPYILGLWLGDGRKGTDTILIDKSMNYYFIDIARTLNCDIKFVNHKLSTKVNYVKLYKLSTNKGYFISILNRFKLKNNKHIPEQVLRWSKESRLQLLAGLIDSDGWLEYNKNKTTYRYAIYQKDLSFVEMIRRIAMSLGIYSTIRSKSKVTDAKIFNGYVVSLIGDTIKEIPVILERKKIPAEWKRSNDVLRTASLTIESLGIGTYYGFTLIGDKLEDHLFILEDGTITKNCGDWSTGKGDLKSCIGASIGSWRVGSINKCRVFMIGTGGSVASDQIKDVFKNPEAYNLLQFKDFAPKSAFFLPAYYFLGGQGWEETSVNNNDSAKKYLEEERTRTKDDMEIHNKIVQEFPFTIEEVFRKSGTNNFNQRKIATQWSALHYELEGHKPEKGFLTWIKTATGTIKGVKWELNPEGNIEILEHPYKGQTGREVFTDLYVGGVDSIDQGIMDSTSIKNRSSLACLIKKRIIDGKFFSQTSNIYVAKYLGRSLDVRWDYEETLKLSMYYNAKMNIEYTKIGVVNYFREAKQYHRLLKRPLVAMPSGGDGSNKIPGLQKDHSNLIGTPATTGVIDHQDGKIKEYIEDYYNNIFFIDLLEQLRDYQREDRRKYDLVIAMGLCELADEDMFGIAARGEDSPTSEFVPFGWYNDEHGRKKFGKIPGKSSPEKEALNKPGAMSLATWIDISGKPRFDDNFEIGDADDLPINKSSSQEEQI